MTVLAFLLRQIVTNAPLRRTLNTCVSPLRKQKINGKYLFLQSFHGHSVSD